jgi:CheY-like chemotaxis protein
MISALRSLGTLSGEAGTADPLAMPLEANPSFGWGGASRDRSRARSEEPRGRQERRDAEPGRPGPVEVARPPADPVPGREPEAGALPVREAGTARALSPLAAVLVVEDDAAFRLSLTAALGGRYSLGEAESVDGALAALAERSYDILLTDFQLGDRDAVELLEKLPVLAPNTRPIVMSAFATARDYQAAMALSVVTVLCKPFSQSELLEALQRAIECETGFRGSVHGLALTDMLQMFHYAKRSVVVDVTLVAGMSHGRIYLEQGEIVHAEAEGTVGEPALQVLLSAKTGALATSSLVKPVARTIDRDLQALLLDLFRLIDEDARPETDGIAESSFTPNSNAVSADLGSNLERRNKIMATDKELQDILAGIESEISGFMAASIVDLESGMTLATRSTRPDFDLTAASAYNSEMVKQKLKIIRVLNLKATLEDMLLTLSDQIHLIKMISPGTFLYLAADKALTNLAIARSVVTRQLVNFK